MRVNLNPSLKIIIIMKIIGTNKIQQVFNLANKRKDTIINHKFIEEEIGNVPGVCRTWIIVDITIVTNVINYT